MPRPTRQFFAYAAVLATGLASVATQPCEYSITAETPPTTVDLGAQGAEVTLGFRVRTNYHLEQVNVAARLVLGEGNATIVVPDVWLGPGSGNSIPDGGVAVPFTVDAAGASATVCSGVCAPEFDVLVRRSVGVDEGRVQLVVSVLSGSLSCDDGAGDHYLVVERVR